MECYCSGRLEEGMSSYRVSRDNFCIIIENIPAYKCKNCNKILFRAEIVDSIYKLVNKIEREINEIVTGKPSINVYDY